MALIDESTTVGSLVNLHPVLAGEFERHGIDYCCGGGRTLADACADLGLDLTATLAELAMVAAVPAESRGDADWSIMGPAGLVDHLEATHHRYLWEEMPRLSTLIAKIVSVHGERHPELVTISACFGEVRADLEPHLLREERVLFPMIRELVSAPQHGQAPSFHCGSLRNPISVMLGEHDAVGELLARLRQLTNGYRPPADGCASYVACFGALQAFEADTHLHIHKENNLLFPSVVDMEQERPRTAQ